MSELTLKIKTALNDDIRLFKGKFKDLKDAFNKLQLFINKSYKLNDSKEYIMQYKDDENDLVTIATELDLEDAIEQANDMKKSVKIFIKLSKQKKVINNNNNNNDNIKNDEIKDDIIEGDDDKVNDKNDLTGVLCNDICKNEKFKKEFISFLTTIILLYQSNSTNDDKMDLTTCIVTALSKHSMIAEHKQIKEFTSKMNMFIPQIEMFISGILLNFDVKNIEVMVNKFVENKKNGTNSCHMFQSMGLGFPFMMLGNIFNSVGSMFEPKNCPGKHGLYYFNTPSASYSCDVCQAKMNQSSPMYGCRICNYDLCAICYNSNNNNNYNTNFNNNFNGFQGFGMPFGASFGTPFGCGFRPGGPFGFHGGHKRFGHGGKFGRRHGHGHGHGHGHHGYGHGHHGHHGYGRRFRHGCYNNNNNNNNNNNDKDDERLKADVIENPMPKISNIVDPKQGIMKIWKIKNTGTKNLPKGLIVKYSGRSNNPMVTSEQFYIGNDNEIKPGETFTVTISITTPQVYGRFSSNWRLCTPDGKKFGQKLPFYLILSPPQNNNNNDQKSDDSLRDSEVDELTSKVVNEVAKEKNNDNNNDEKKQDLKNNDNDNSDNNNDVDMEINDSDDDNVVDAVDELKSDEPKKDEPKKDEPKKDEPKKDEPKKDEPKKDEPKKDEPKKDEPKKDEPKKDVKVNPYEYENELNELKAMGFNDDDYLKGLLNANQGSINQVITLLFGNNN